MLANSQTVGALQERLQTYSDTQTLSSKSGVSEIIIRRIRNGLQTDVRSHTVDMLNRSLDNLSS